MRYLLLLVILLYGFFLAKALFRFIACGCSPKRFMSENTYAWFGFLAIITILMVVIGGVGWAIMTMVGATL